MASVNWSPPNYFHLPKTRRSTWQEFCQSAKKQLKSSILKRWCAQRLRRRFRVARILSNWGQSRERQPDGSTKDPDDREQRLFRKAPERCAEAARLRCSHLRAIRLCAHNARVEYS